MTANDALPCRLCLVTPPVVDPASFPDILAAALDGGDVASLFIFGDGSPASTQRVAELIVPVAQAKGVAAIVLNDTRLLGRTGADGILVDTGLPDFRTALETYRGKRFVGAGGIRSRDDAMAFGQSEPDFLFFGRLDGDTDAAIFRKTFDLAAWWSGLFEIPAVVMGGNGVTSVAQAAESGIEFVALRQAVWENPAGPAAAVAEAITLLAATVLT